MINLDWKKSPSPQLKYSFYFPLTDALERYAHKIRSFNCCGHGDMWPSKSSGSL
ncbi:Hypothetical Protein XCAW_02839 [Xanthomonas citri subsp. citri Aw12879]|nr:Hypothetical Protein XCAW_02839 [Xanthomonas citri subsp. citri Aw12879]